MKSFGESQLLDEMRLFARKKNCRGEMGGSLLPTQSLDKDHTKDRGPCAVDYMVRIFNEQFGRKFAQ